MNAETIHNGLLLLAYVGGVIAVVGSLSIIYALFVDWLDSDD